MFSEFKTHLRRYELFVFVMYRGPERFIGQIKDWNGKLICQSSGKTKKDAEIHLMDAWNKS